jgi:hypothetical protein
VAPELLMEAVELELQDAAQEHGVWVGWRAGGQVGGRPLGERVGGWACARERVLHHGWSQRNKQQHRAKFVDQSNSAFPRWLPACLPADTTGSMIVGMLSKKLERMAAKTTRRQRLRRRAARQAESVAAAAAAAGAAVPQAAALPQQQASEAAAAKAAEAEAEAGVEEAAPLGFWAALKRLLRDPQVSIFFFLTTLLGFGHGIVGSFLFMHLAQLGEDGGGADRGSAVQCSLQLAARAGSRSVMRCNMRCTSPLRLSSALSCLCPLKNSRLPCLQAPARC